MTVTLPHSDDGFGAGREGDLFREWDVLVVGTGMGGATLGHALAKAGKSVLFCELGAGLSSKSLRGQYPELVRERTGGPLDRQDLLRAGRCADRLTDISQPRHRTFVPFIGSGPGGSSALYGMAMERLQPADFRPAEHYPEAPGSALEPEWPITYDELAPYYDEAERLYRVRGERDPLATSGVANAQTPTLLPPLPLSPAGAELAKFLTGRGLHPYQLPSACEALPECQTCQGYLCPQRCKNDAAQICLIPALQEHGARLLEDCRVLDVLVQGSRATGVTCRWRGQDLKLRARAVILAAGALYSPLILLRSRNGKGGGGLGGGPALVGRHLMRHLIDIYLVRPARDSAEPFDNRRKEIAFNDFYAGGPEKLGTVQSFGRLPPADMLFGSLRDDLAASRWSWAAGLMPAVRPFLRPVLHDMAENWFALATMAEDLPYPENAVEPDPTSLDQLRLHYNLRSEARQRVITFRRRMADTLRGRRWRRLPQTENNQRIAHACGTCRFGNDPRRSVLDRNNRVHDIDNLFVVDSSFFPSSGGTNPSLTIAANALRVGARLCATI